MDLEETFDKMYKASSNQNHKVVAYSLYNIIQIKIINPQWNSYTNSLYKDIKAFIFHYVLAVEIEGYGYDLVSVDKILNAINALEKYEEKAKLLQFAYCKLKKAGLDDEIALIRREQKRILLLSIFHSETCWGKIKAIVYVCFYNVWTVMAVSLVIMLVYYFLTLPVLDESEAWFLIDGKVYESNLYSNHFANILGSVFGFNDNVYCQPTSLFTELVLIFFKILGSAIVSGCLLKLLGRYCYLKILEYED